MTHSPRQQQGAITLMVTIVLVMLAGLASFYSVQSIFIDRLASQAQIQATHAHLAAQAALAWAQAEIQRTVQSTSATAFWSAWPTTRCPDNRTELQWQCVRLQVPPVPGAETASIHVLALRDVVKAPHVTELQASALLDDQRSRAQDQQSLFMPTVLPVPASASATAVVLSTGTNTPCASTAWQQVLGDLDAEHIKAWSQAQERQGLHALSQPPRSIYWVDSPAIWTQSLGSPQAPVLLVFSATACSPLCPSMASGVRIHGTVVLDTQCQQDRARGWRAGQIDGQLLINSAWPEAPNASQVSAQPYARQAYLLPWPLGMDARQVQIVNGSWREGAP